MCQEALGQQAATLHPPTVSPQAQAQFVYLPPPGLSLLHPGTRLNLACVQHAAATGYLSAS